MDVFVASENTFNAAHLSKPKRIVEIPSNAPVQTRHDEVEFSSGTFTFPSATPWRDRFITWRATGTLLILEERSVRHSVIDSCIAFNFSRAPIVPGTTISLLNNLLSVVVTTQSSVHRFMCRLAVDESDDNSESVESTLSQLLDVVVSKEMLRADFHDVHQLAARSTPVRAAVAVRPAETRVAVGLSDGQMVVVVLGNGIGGKIEELQVSEAGFMQRFVGKTLTGVMDLCTEREEGRRAGDVDFTPFYTVNKDSTIRIVNGDTCQTALSVPWDDFVAIDGDVLHASIRWTKCGDNGLIVVAVTTSNSVHFVLLRDLERQQLVRVASSRKATHSRVIDFGVHEMGGRDVARLWIVSGMAPPQMGREGMEGAEGTERREEDAMVRPADTYTLEYMDLHLPSSSSHRSDSQEIHRLNTQWKRVKGVGETLAERFSLRHKLRQETATAASNNKENVQMLRREVFNVENNQFDVVLRAVKIATDNSSSLRLDHNDWAGLIAAVDTYIRSSEFDRKFGSSDWQTTSVVNTRDVKSEAEMRFYRALSCSCSEIAGSMARPLGLFMSPLAGTHLVGVIQETRLTVVVDACGELADRLSEQQLHAFAKALDEGKEDEDKSPASSPKEKEKKRSRVTYERMDSDDGEDLLTEAVQLFVRRARRLVNGVERNGREDEEEGEERMDDSSNSSSDESPTSLSSDPMSDEDCCSPYGGSFSAGLISCLLRCRIVDEHAIASRLLRVIQKENGRADLEEYRDSLMSIVKTLGILAAQLDIHIERESGGIDSLAGWLFSAQALPLLRIEGGYEIDVNMTGDEDEERPPLHLFINRSVMAVLSAIHPLSPTQSIPKLLAVRDKHETIKRVYSLWGDQLPPSLKYVAAYYNGIALSGTGMPRKALDQFKEAANGMRMGDKMLTRALVPLGLIRGKRQQEEAEIGIGVFYVNVIKVLNEHGHQQEVIDMSRESMNNLPEGSHLSSINATLFKRQVDGDQWSEALATIESTLDPALRRHLLHELLSRLLAAGEWQMIISAEFGANTNMVESIILNHARSVDVGSANPHPFELVSAFHVSRNNYYQGALVHYELAVALRSVPMSPEILMRCKRAVTMTLTLLDLMPEHKRFIAFPHIVTFSSGTRKTMMIVKYEELKREWIMLRGRCALLSAVNSSIPPDEPTALIKALTQARMYVSAMEMCRVLDEDPSELIEHATTTAISVDVSGEEVMPAWVGANRRLAHKKEKLEHWSVVRALVKECRERWPKDERSLRAALKAFLAHDIPIPYWLHTKFSKCNVGGYCRLLIDYGGAEAVDTALAVLHDCYKREADRIVDADTRTLLPHIVTEEVMEVAKKETSPETRMLLDKLSSIVLVHQQRATSFARASKFS